MKSNQNVSNTPNKSDYFGSYSTPSDSIEESNQTSTTYLPIFDSSTGSKIILDEDYTDGSVAYTKEAQYVELFDNGTPDDSSDDIFYLAVKEKIETYSEILSDSWSIYTVNLDGTFNSDQISDVNIKDFEDKFGQDIDGDGITGFDTTLLTSISTDISSDGGSLKTTGGALFIVDGLNEYKIENIYGSSQYGDVGYAVEKQSDGSYLLANKHSQNWEFVSLSAQGIISDEPSIFTTDITDYEILINEDLDNDGAIGLNLNALTDVTYDDSGYQLKYDGDGSIYIWDGSDINTIISVVNDAGSSPIYEYSDSGITSNLYA